MQVIIKNVPQSKSMTIETNAKTYGELSKEAEEFDTEGIFRPDFKAVMRHNRNELSADSELPTDMDTVKINLFTQKLDSGYIN